MRHQRFELGAKDELTVVQKGVIQGLHPEAVAYQEKSLLIAIPQRKREHAAKTMHAGFAPGLPGVDDHLRVGMRTKHVAQRLQFGHQFLKIVDFAIENHHHTVVLIE